MVAAANPALFNNRAACGARYTVQCTGPTNQGVPQPCRNGPITVTIVDLCPGCAADQIDLSEQAFNQIADPAAGRIRIEYNRLASIFFLISLIYLTWLFRFNSTDYGHDFAGFDCFKYGKNNILFIYRSFSSTMFYNYIQLLVQ